MVDTVYGIAFGLIIAGAIMKWSDSPRVKNGKVFLWAGLILVLVTTAIDYQDSWKEFKAGWVSNHSGSHLSIHRPGKIECPPPSGRSSQHFS